MPILRFYHENISISRPVQADISRRVRTLGALHSWVFGWMFLFSVLSGDMAFAHKVKVFSYVDEGMVVVEGYVGGRSACKNCGVSILDVRGTEIAKGKTNQSGKFTMKIEEIPRSAGDLTIVLDAGYGHKAKYTLPARDLVGVPVTGPPATKQATSGTRGSRSQDESDERETVTTDPPLTREQIEEIVGRAVDDALAPLMKMVTAQQRLLLARETKGPGIAEIVGGVGWIFGLVGIAAYFLSRKRPRSE